MAAAARKLKRLLLIIAITAVIRPCKPGLQDQQRYEDPRSGFWQLDGADCTSSVRGPSFPIWQVLSHYGRIESAVTRAIRRRLCRYGQHQTARHPLILSGMCTTRPPASIFASIFAGKHQSESTLTTFIGTGAYFLIILLASGNIEPNPGPEDAPQDLIEQIGKLLETQLTAKLNVTNQHISASNEGIKALRTSVDGIADQLNSVNKKVDALTAEKNALSARVSVLEKRLAILEKDRRKKNMVVFGLSSTAPIEDAVNEVLFKKLQLEERPSRDIVESQFRIGDPKGEKRPIIIRFRSEADKDRAMRNAGKLKGTSIVVSDDLTPEERCARRKLVEARNQANKIGLLAKLQRNFLVVEGEKLTSDDVSKPGWLRKYQQSRATDNQGIDAEAESESGNPTDDGRPKKKKRTRQEAAISPSDPPLPPPAGQPLDFATAPLNSNKDKQEKAVGKPQRGRMVERRLRSATGSSNGSDSERSHQN
ncbi:uncharacterized protein LOC135933887 [Cloeon dipterum]|uniref:uncharacterized protein LOC135933887 n=1 Tax=Cloeon dipterum TaxID=197152 RepID=UPI00322094BE